MGLVFTLSSYAEKSKTPFVNPKLQLTISSKLLNSGEVKS